MRTVLILTTYAAVLGSMTDVTNAHASTVNYHHIHNASAASEIVKMGRYVNSPAGRKAIDKAIKLVQKRAKEAKQKAEKLFKKTERLGGDVLASAYDFFDRIAEDLKTADRKKIDELTKELEQTRKQLVDAKHKNEYLQAQYKTLSIQFLELLKMMQADKGQLEIMM